MNRTYWLCGKGSGLRSVSAHRNHKVDIICDVGGTGGGARTYSADNVRITSQGYWIKEPQSGVCTGIVAECKHCGGAKDCRKDCEFVCGNYVYFHRGFGLCQLRKQALCQEPERRLRNVVSSDALTS